VAIRAAEEEEISLELIFPLEISPLDSAPILESIARTGKLLVIEEGATGFDLASEVITAASLGYRGEQRLRVQRIGASPMPLPSAMELERAALPSEGTVYDACLELFDE
jgi:pyruvate dehydrogenase E1 component beta subunit